MDETDSWTYALEENKKKHFFLILLPLEFTKTLTWNNSEPVYFHMLPFFLFVFLFFEKYPAFLDLSIDL